MARTKLFIELLKHAKVNVNLQNKNGDTALCVSSKYGRSKVVVELLRHREVNVNLQNNDGDTAL